MSSGIAIGRAICRLEAGSAWAPVRLPNGSTNLGAPTQHFVHLRLRVEHWYARDSPREARSERCPHYRDSANLAHVEFPTSPNAARQHQARTMSLGGLMQVSAFVQLTYGIALAAMPMLAVGVFLITFHHLTVGALTRCFAVAALLGLIVPAAFSGLRSSGHTKESDFPVAAEALVAPYRRLWMRESRHLNPASVE